VTKKRSPKIENLLEKIKECLEQKRYTQTEHAIVRQKEREITLAEIRHVLITGYEEKIKTPSMSSTIRGIMQLEAKQK
jgi:hypothetical protein